MLEILRAWLNGSREYFSGVFIYLQVGDNLELKALLKKSQSDYCKKRLEKELLDICNQLKGAAAPTDTPTAPVSFPATISIPLADPLTPPVAVGNPDLLAACTMEANKKYKEAMNTRAVLFAMVPSELYEDPNRPDLVDSRSALSVKVVQLYNEASRLYDRADYVREHGVLPDPPDLGSDTDQVPDHLVKPKLDNLRKNYNKIKGREQTPERVVLMQKHEADILKLETRWLSLKPNK